MEFEFLKSHPDLPGTNELNWESLPGGCCFSLSIQCNMSQSHRSHLEGVLPRHNNNTSEKNGVSEIVYEYDCLNILDLKTMYDSKRKTEVWK